MIYLAAVLLDAPAVPAFLFDYDLARGQRVEMARSADEPLCRGAVLQDLVRLFAPRKSSRFVAAPLAKSGNAHLLFVPSNWPTQATGRICCRSSV